MHKPLRQVLPLLLAVCMAVGALSWAAADQQGTSKRLPSPRTTGNVSVEEAIAQRRSVRSLADTPLSPEQIGQLLWSGQGITDAERGFRAAPSAGALYPLELYVVTAEGVEHYDPANHSLRPHMAEDVRPAIQRASLDQEFISVAPLNIVIAAVIERTEARYGERAEKFCMLEVGHAAQNILLQATAMQLVGVPVGAYDEADVKSILQLPENHRVLYMLPIGNRK